MIHINELSPKCKEVFIMSRFDEFSNHEIAQKRNLSIYTVEKHISNALKNLRSTISTFRFWNSRTGFSHKYITIFGNIQPSWIF